jgi:adenylate kinase family enzyme
VERVAVIGCGGSGKTTLSNRIGELLDLPVIHIDGFYWCEVPGLGRVESPPDAWYTTHRKLIGRPSWVIDGMKLGVLAERLERADTVVFLDLSTWACLWGVLRRREGGVNWAFLRWIWNFRRVHRPRVVALLESCSCEVVVLRSRRDADRYIATLAATHSEQLAAAA